ncbi:hypothetical protein Syun_028841 [Stephania yunnanensis]|uniref:ubiquitinyl hydrolase 1 n=1 Tax=Stephania yunnanensis TaxID=152371 RepID=A0AAP0E8V2_9MAGN
MDGPINGGMLYYEVQELKLCAVHCVNTVLQGPFFSEFDFAALASDLDRTERQMMIRAPAISRGLAVPRTSRTMSQWAVISIRSAIYLMFLDLVISSLMMFLIAFEFAKMKRMEFQLEKE